MDDDYDSHNCDDDDSDIYDDNSIHLKYDKI